MKKYLCMLVSVLLIMSMLTGCSNIKAIIREWVAEPTENNEPVEINKPTEPVREELKPVDIAEKAAAATVTVDTTYGTGSGFFIDDQGTLVTCYHVIDAAEKITITLNDGGVYNVDTIVDFNDAYDLAVLKVAISGNDYLKICDEQVRQGESVYAIGSSLGFLDGTFSDGMVSSTSRIIGVIDYIQTTAPISSGNSGGPLVNAYGEVIGVCAAGYTSGENLNLAVSMDMLNKLSMDKNWSISKFNEWYSKEIRRSYRIFSYTNEEFEYSLTNTYQHITGRECYASDQTWDALYQYSSTLISGYREDYRVYFYDYNVNERDQYTDYLLENGYVFLGVEEFDIGTSYYYGNEHYGFYMDIFVTDDEEYIVIEAYCY